MLQKIQAWFSAQRRQAIQLFLGSLAPLAVLSGFATEGQTGQALVIAGAVLLFAASVLSLANVKRGDWGVAWAIVRGAIYTLAATVSPALVLLGVYGEEQNKALMLALSLSLSALSSLTAVFAGGQQQVQSLEGAIEASYLPGIKRSL